jgi:hypothetical protein
MSGGENYLMQLSAATGGESYNEGFGNPVSLSPFLSDIQRQFENQYELEFASSTRKGMLRLQVKTSQPHTKLQAAKQVFARTAARNQ